MEYLDVHGDRVPALGLGTWQLRGRQCRKAVTEALDLGYRHIDTAQMYDNEGEIGAVLADSDVERQDLFLVTKIANSEHLGDRVRASTEASLRSLRTEYVDLLLIHWPVEWDIVEETLAAMVALRDEGKIRHVGVSNFDPSQLERALELAPVAANQVEFHPYLRQDELLDLARRHSLTITAYSPLARSKVADDGVIAEIAERHGATPAQVSLRWLLDHEWVSVIPKASSRSHLEENLGALELRLTDDDRASIDSLDRANSVL